MQITPLILANNLLQNVQTQENRISQLQSEATTGQVFQVPSDNPVAAENTLSLNDALSSVNAYQTSANQAAGWLNQTSGALSSAISLFQSVISTATQAANGTLNSADLNAIAEAVAQDQKTYAQILNSQYNGEYLFGGYQGAGAPLTVNPSTGLASWPAESTQLMRFALGNSSTVTVNLTGFENVGQPTGTNYFQQSYNDLTQLVNDLKTNPSNLANDLGALNNDLAYLTSAQSLVGGRLNRVQDIQTQLHSVAYNLQEGVAQTGGADIASVTVELAQAQQAYQAALQSGSQILPMSLLSFINP
ncbi:flagellar hook-associated protein 3 [Sulfobacillus acidophilus TPY]|uniref:Flagellar hook-associated protein 3 n=1 Tax=Sulfobacillus acidophilus (strain ATCC 700253 / DSM 10332 / NAL) TaxID=679936 RepID=G8U1G5_SULAD|nr:flagellar hook-associated protein 3 [Sulfobacillus acidophilus TPY]AEW06570.1 flagellar hook-associated protein 3 [Sulfobacillus acidophilus DSM 10332]